MLKCSDNSIDVILCLLYGRLEQDKVQVVQELCTVINHQLSVLLGYHLNPVLLLQYKQRFCTTPIYITLAVI